MDRMARTNHQRLICLFCDTRSGRWRGMSQGMHLSETSPLNYLAGILTWEFDLCWYRRSPFSAYPEITWRAFLNRLHSLGS